MLITVQGHTAGVKSVTWSPDGRYIASGAEQGIRDSSIKIWDIETGNEIRTIPGDCSPIGVRSVDWSPDGKYIAATDCVSGKISMVKVWKADSGTLLRTFEVSDVSSVAWSPDGRYLASGGSTFYPRISVWETDRLIISLDGVVLTWSPDSRYIASVAMDRNINIWEVITGSLERVIEGYPDEPYIPGVVWSPNGRYLASWSSTARTIKIRDSETGQLIREIQSGAVNSLSWSPDSKYLAGGDPGGGPVYPEIRIWEVETGNLIKTLQGPGTSIRWSGDGRYIASGGLDGTVRLWGERSKE